MSDGVAVDVHCAKLPWGAWNGDLARSFEFPASWRLVELQMTDAPALTHDEVVSALDRPFGAPRLDAIAAGCQTAAIAVDDLTRPTDTAPLIEWIVQRLLGTGLDLANLTIVVASGAHRRACERDLAFKVGALARRIRVIPHDPEAPLADTHVSLAGVPIRLNRAFVEADLRIGVGCVMPHPFAGFSGGAKIVVPGLAGLDVLARTHKFALMGLHGGASLEGNGFRAQMEAAVRQIGLHWTVNVVVNSRRETAFIAAGDLLAAHRAAVEAAARIGATSLPEDQLDAIVVNAYPKDGELLQVEAALVSLRNGLLDRLRPDAPVVLTAACPDGVGTHLLFGPNGRLFRAPSVKSFLRGRPLWLFSPGIDTGGARVLLHESYPFHTKWSELIDALQERIGPTACVGVLPCAPLQVVRGER